MGGRGGVAFLFSFFRAEVLIGRRELEPDSRHRTPGSRRPARTGLITIDNRVAGGGRFCLSDRGGVTITSPPVRHV